MNIVSEAGRAACIQRIQSYGDLQKLFGKRTVLAVWIDLIYCLQPIGEDLQKWKDECAIGIHLDVMRFLQMAAEIARKQRTYETLTR